MVINVRHVLFSISNDTVLVFGTLMKYKLKNDFIAFFYGMKH